MPFRQIRAASLGKYVAVAASLGIDGRALLREAGVPVEAIKDPHTSLPALPVIRLFERTAELSGCESFGLQMAQARSFGSLGPLTLLLERLPNIREAVHATIEFLYLFNDVLAMSLEEHGDVCAIRLDMLPGYQSPQIIDLAVGLAYLALAGASARKWRPEAVHLTRQRPLDPGPWRRFFAAPVIFAEPFNGFTTTAVALDAPNPHADELMARHARRLLKFIPREGVPSSFAERGIRAITQLLPNADATLARVAGQLGLSPRSLQRQLKDEGQQFGQLVDDVRRELARTYLLESDRSITSIAGLLGYHSPSSFTRWFSATFGSSPQAWRAKHRGSVSA